MADTKETKIKKQINKYLQKRGILYWSHSDRYGSGWPDKEIIYNGRTIRIEVKSAVGNLKPMQEYIINKIKEAGGEAYVVRSVEELDRIIYGDKETVPFDQER